MTIVQISLEHVSITDCECFPRMREDLDEARMVKDEERVSKILTTIACMTDPFTYVGEELIYCAQGRVERQRW